MLRRNGTSKESVEIAMMEEEEEMYQSYHIIIGSTYLQASLQQRVFQPVCLCLSVCFVLTNGRPLCRELA